MSSIGGQRSEHECLVSELEALAPVLERAAWLHRRLAELYRAKQDDFCGEGDDAPENGLNVVFRDSDLSVRWNGGQIKFQASGSKQYRFLKMVYESGEDGVAHEEVADELYGDQLADIKNVIKNVRRRLEDAGFQYELENNGKILKFLTP